MSLGTIFCIGELLEERDAGKTDEVNRRQLSAAIPHIRRWDRVVIAYEPVWAIGTGRTATPDDAQQVCASIRAAVAASFGADAATGVRIQYGGSVKSGNIADLMAQPDIDGALVGGASLDPDEFARIVQHTAS